MSLDDMNLSLLPCCSQNQMDLEPPFPWMEGKPDTLRHHLANETGTVFEYTRSRRIALGRQLLKLRRIYLDTKYWIYARDVHMGRPQKPIHVEIVEELRRLRRNNSTICPVSYSVFSELLSQSDSATRAATAKIIDEFSDDCAILPFFEIFKGELYHFYQKLVQPNVKLFPVSELVWTKAAFVAGDVFLNMEESGLPEQVTSAMAKAMDDFFWEAKLSEVIDTLPFDPKESDEINSLASKLTQGKFEHWNPNDSFRKIFLDEVAGVIDSLSDVIGDFLSHVANQHGFNDPMDNEAILRFGRMFGGVIHGAFALERITREFPTIEIPATLHAAVRIDRNRKYKKGDTEDFFHAVTALGYYDIFLTESSLKHLLLSKEVNLGEKYACVVLSAEAEVLEYLRTLV